MHIFSAFFTTALQMIANLLHIYIYVVFANAVLSWLVAFDIINPHNKFVRMVGDLTYRITEPALRPIRRILPPMGGLDLSPLVLVAIIWFLQLFILNLMTQM